MPPMSATPGTKNPGKGGGEVGVVVPPGQRPTWMGGTAVGTGVGSSDGLVILIGVVGAPVGPTRINEEEGDPYLRGNVRRRWAMVSS